MLQDVADHGLRTSFMFIKLILTKELVHQLLNLRSVDLIFLYVFQLT